MEALEEIVRTLEAGDVPLEKLVAIYQRGVELQKICQSHLDRAAFVIEQLKSNGEVVPLSLPSDKE